MGLLETGAGVAALLALIAPGGGRAADPSPAGAGTVRVLEDPIPAPVRKSLLVTSLHGADASHVWAIGTYHGDGPYDRAALLRFDGTAWHVDPIADDDRAMRAVYAAAADDGWRVGAAGAYARWDGKRWTSGKLELAAVGAHLPGSYHDLTGVIAWPGEAWVSDASTGYFRFSNGRFSAETYGSSAKRHVHGPAGTRPGDVWALLDMGTLAHFDGTSWRDVPGPATDDSLVQVAPGADGELWLLGAFRGVFTKGTHVYRREGEKWTETPVPTGKRVFHLAARGRGEAWAAAGDGVYRWDGRAWSSVPGVPKGSYGLVHRTPDGTVFLAGEIGARIVRIVPVRP